MKFTYFGIPPKINDNGFNFRIDAIVNGHDDVQFNMDFTPDLQPGYELLAVPEYTPPGWVFKHLIENFNGLVAVYEPIRDIIDPRDESPQNTQLRIYVVKTTKQEYPEDE